MVSTCMARHQFEDLIAWGLVTESPYQLYFPYFLQPGGSWDTGGWKTAPCCGRIECLRQEVAHWVCSSVKYPVRTISHAHLEFATCTSVYPDAQWCEKTKWLTADCLCFEIGLTTVDVSFPVPFFQPCYMQGVFCILFYRQILNTQSWAHSLIYNLGESRKLFLGGVWYGGVLRGFNFRFIYIIQPMFTTLHFFLGRT